MFNWQNLNFDVTFMRSIGREELDIRESKDERMHSDDKGWQHSTGGGGGTSQHKEGKEESDRN